jgi:type IV pilus assembly protein PilY1
VRIPGTFRYLVLIGSGDREKPTAGHGAALSVANYFYAIVDDPSDSAWLESERLRCNEPTICGDSLTGVAIHRNEFPDSGISEKGWKISLRHAEQVVSAALTINDQVYFSTHRPGLAATCSNNLGVAARYRVDYRFGGGDLLDLPEGGLLPTPVAGRVELDNGEIVPFCIGCDGGRAGVGADGAAPAMDAAKPKSRVSWRIEQ